jgi:hypothetical protein
LPGRRGPAILPFRQQHPDDLAWEVAGLPGWSVMTLQGRVLAGRYALGAMLGSGGMGQVYRVRDRVLERTVAVKVLSPVATDDRELVARFGREARAAAALHHARGCRDGYPLPRRVGQGSPLCQFWQAAPSLRWTCLSKALPVALGPLRRHRQDVGTYFHP